MFKKRFFFNLPPVDHGTVKMASLTGTRTHWDFRSLKEHRTMFRELFCDCKFCLTMEFEQMENCEKQRNCRGGKQLGAQYFL